MGKLSKEELIKLIDEVRNMSACRSDFDSVMNRLEKETGCAEIGAWLFNPPDGKVYTAKEIVEQLVK